MSLEDNSRKINYTMMKPARLSRKSMRETLSISDTNLINKNMKNNIFISTSCRYGKLVQPEPYHHLIHHTHNTNVSKSCGITRAYSGLLPKGFPS